LRSITRDGIAALSGIPIAGATHVTLVLGGAYNIGPSARALVANIIIGARVVIITGGTIPFVAEAAAPIARVADATLFAVVVVVRSASLIRALALAIIALIIGRTGVLIVAMNAVVLGGVAARAIAALSRLVALIEGPTAHGSTSACSVVTFVAESTGIMVGAAAAVTLGGIVALTSHRVAYTAVLALVRSLARNPVASSTTTAVIALIILGASIAIVATGAIVPVGEGALASVAVATTILA